MFDLIYPTPTGLDKLKGKKPASHTTGQPRPTEPSDMARWENDGLPNVQPRPAGKSKTI
jgi:hypothetical protein